MIKFLLAISLLLLTSAIMAQQAIKMEIKTLPHYHPSGSDIYIAGTFNGWNPQDEKYKFSKDNSGNYYIDLKFTEGNYEYKITRGGWNNAECKLDGVSMENRSLNVPSATAVSIVIEEWADRFPHAPKLSTASPNVQIIDTAFLIPKLKRTRRIWIYLPENYNRDPGSRYPVLYMQDGQNIFDDATSYAGEWGVDEYLDSTRLKKCIVVAIDNGGIKRITEYNPFDNANNGKAEGGKYVEFLVKTLKPYIDKSYRTLKDKRNTFIAGSSMGGLIAMYAVLKYPGIFGAAGIFSPAFHIGGPEIYKCIKRRGKKVNSNIYFYGGKQENETMVPDMLKAFEMMSKVSVSKMTTVIRDEGKHNEARWRVEFPLFYEWVVREL